MEWVSYPLRKAVGGFNSKGTLDLPIVLKGLPKKRARDFGKLIGWLWVKKVIWISQHSLKTCSSKF